MRYEGRPHEIKVIEGYRVAFAKCKCGWHGDARETMDEALLDYRKHLEEYSESIRRT